MTSDLPPLRLDPRAATQSWYARSGVRAGPRRTVVGPDDLVGKTFFPQHLVPHLQHDALRDIDPQRYRFLNAQHLFQWLDFTSRFEVAVVNRATERIANNTVGFELSGSARLAAFQIYVDEGYHSLYNLDVRLQLEAASGLAGLPFEFAPYLARLDAIGSGLPDLRELIQLLQVVIFETSVTSILLDIPKDATVVQVVRDVVRDHAIDEGHHHAYFASLFRELWWQLQRPTQQRLAAFMPQLISRSLAPHHLSSQRAMAAAGVPADVIAAVLADTYGPGATIDYVRRASARTVALFDECGVLDLPGVFDAFAAVGLAPGSRRDPTAMSAGRPS